MKTDYNIPVLGIVVCLPLYVFGYLAHNTVGFIYFNQEKDVIRIAYTDFWGRRKDIESSTNDWQLKSETESRPSIFGSRLVKLSTNESFRVNLRYGIILDNSINEKLYK